MRGDPEPDWTLQSSYPITCSDISLVSLSTNGNFLYALDRLHHLHLLPNVGFVVKWGILLGIYLFLFIFCPGENEGDVGTNTEKRQKDQLKAATYE